MPAQWMYIIATDFTNGFYQISLSMKYFILVVREWVTSYTATMLVDSEQHDALRDILIRLCI